MTEKRFENRLNKNNVKFNTLNPVWDNEKEDALNVFEMMELLNTQHERIQELYDSDKSLRKLCSNMTHNWSGISVNRRLFLETVKTLRRLGCDNIADDLEKTSIDTSVNG